MNGPMKFGPLYPDAGAWAAPPAFAARGAGGLLTWYHGAVLAAALGIIFANLPVYAYALNPGWLPKYFFFLLFAAISPLLLLRSRALGGYLTSPFALWITCAIALHLVHYIAFTFDGNPAALDHGRYEERAALILTRTQYAVFAWFLGFAVHASRRTGWQAVFTWLAVLLPCAVIADFLRPGLLYPVDTPGAVLGRAAAMFINPTMAGEALLLAFVFSCAATPMKYRLPLYVLTGAAVLLTFSRSSIIGWMLLGPLLATGRVLPRYTLGVMLALGAAALAAFGVFEAYLGQRHDFGEAIDNLQARLDFFSSADLGDDSARERAAVLKAGIDLYLANPVFGAGAGATQFWSAPVSTHNQLLMLAGEYGVFGIALWAWLLRLLWKGQFFPSRRLRFALVFLFVFMTLFTHQMFDSATYWLATFAIAGLRRRSRAAGGPHA